MDFQNADLIDYLNLSSPASQNSSPFQESILSSPQLTPEYLSSPNDYSSSLDSLPHSDDVPSNSFDMEFFNEIIDDPNHQLSDLFGDGSLISSITSLPSIPMEDEAESHKRTGSQNLQKKKAPRGKKRQRKDSGEDTDVSAVTLSRDQLLNMNSDEFEDFIAVVTNQRPLSFAEEKKVKDQKRKVKNRESAQNSREKKKSYISELEGQISVFKKEQQQLHNQVAELTSENKRLKSEVSQLETLIKKTELNIDMSFLSKKPSPPSSPIQSHQRKAAGVVLLIVLFSFGLLFNTTLKYGNSLPALPQGLSRVLIDYAPTPVPGRQILQFESPNPISQDKQPLKNHQINFEDTLNAPEQKKQKIQTQINSPLQYEDSIRSIPENVPLTASGLSFGLPKSEGTPLNMDVPKQRRGSITITPGPQRKWDSLHKEVSQKGQDQQITVDMDFMNESIPANISELSGDSNFKYWLSNKVQGRSNTVYLTSSNLQQLIPNHREPYDPRSPMYISILIPTKSPENDTTEFGHENDGVIEIISRVVEVSVPPFLENHVARSVPTAVA